MLKATKPTKANIKVRIKRIHEASDSGREMVRRWNPKGRYFQVQRDMIAFLDMCEEGSGAILEFLERRHSGNDAFTALTTGKLK